MTIHYITVVSAARETVGKILSQRTAGYYNVEVTTNGGRTASVNRTAYEVTLNLPSLAPDTLLTRNEADRMVAYLAHEVCHTLHTDFAQWRAAVADGPRIASWTNALEDVRIEAHEIATGPYGALKGLLSTLVAHLYMESHTALAAKGQKLGEDFINGPYIFTILGRAANGYDLPTTRTLDGQLSPRLRKIMAHALARIGACKSTADCHALAKEIVAIEQATKPAQPQPQPQQPQQGMDSEPGDAGEVDPDAEPQDNASEADDAEGDDADAEPTDEGEGGNGSGDENSKPSQKEFEPDLNLGNTAKDIVKRAGDRGPHDRSHHLNSMRANRVKARNLGSRHAAKALNNQTPHMGVLHGQIARLLVSETKTARTHHETSGRLDRRALTRMTSGATDVFSRRETAPGNDTAVMVLIDCSGSMNARMHLARIAAWSLAKAAESAGGKLAIAGFQGGAASTTLNVVKDWHQTAEQAASGLQSLPTHDYTPLSASIIAASQDLAQITATRRILMVLTDGQCDLGPDAVRSACRLAANFGIETVGIGIACDSVVKAFPERYSVNVNDLDQLAKTGLGALARMLEDAGEGHYA